MEGRRTGKSHTERIYVKVTSEFDTTGSMVPLSITWADGRTFAIEAVRDFRPAGKGREKQLYFEHIGPQFIGRVGRWFVEKTVTA